MKRPGLLLVAAAALFTVLNLVLVVGTMDTARPKPAIGPVVEVFSALAYLATATVGALILSCHPRHRIGWICAIGGTALASAAFASEYPTAADAMPAASGVAWLGAWLWWAACAGLVSLLILLFPDGALPSPRWRPVAWIAATNVAVLAFLHALAPGVLHGEYGVVVNPVGLDRGGALLVDARDLGWVLLVVNLIGALAALVTRLVRASGEQRQQLKWLVYAGSIGVVALPVWAYAEATDGHAPLLGQVVMGLAFVAFPLATGIAILKYRLYDIDVVIHKTMVFGALAAFLALVYGAVVVGIGAVAERVGDLPVSLVATAIVAVGFEPVRQRVQLMANRLVYGQHTSPYEAITGFARRMSQALAFDEVLPEMAEAAVKGVGGTGGVVRLFLTEQGVQEVTWPPGCLVHADYTVEVAHQGTMVGEIAVAKKAGDPVSERDRALLADLALQAGPVLRNVGLTRELRARLKDLQESRQRIVGAQDRERRRVERDIHDGAQQTLVSLTAKLGLARKVLREDPVRAEGIIEEVGEDVSDAVQSLRDLCRGIFPPLLTDRGLVAALDMHVVKGRLPAELCADGVNGHRFAPETEAALYFCAVEALQNASKHATGADITVRLRSEDGWVDLSVADGGPGFDTTVRAEGSGLQNMADRLAAIGGRLDVISAPGQGTIVRARAPVQPTT